MAEHRAFVASTGEGFGRGRRLLQISLRTLADEMGVPHTTLARWERDPRPLDQGRIERWAQALEICDLTRQRAVRRATVARDYHRRHRQDQQKQGD